MNDTYWTVKAMRLWGGSFVKALAECVIAADDENLEKIKRTWPKYWEKYFDLGQGLKEKDAKKP